MRKSCIFTLLVAMAGWPPRIASAEASELKVVADRVHLKAAPSETSETVAQASKGDVLESEKGLAGDWVEVAAPSKLNFWVYSELVRDGVVAVPKLQVRAGPGSDYRALCEIPRNSKVTVRGEYNDWLKIAPPPSCKLWVARKNVEPIDTAVPVSPSVVETRAVPESFPVEPDTAPPTPVPGIKVPTRFSAAPASHVAPVEHEAPAKHLLPTPPKSSTAVVTQVSRFSPEAWIKDKLVESKEQGRSVRFTGVLRRVSFFVWRQPSKHRLVTYGEHGVAETACYVMGDEAQLLSAEGKTVTVSGREYWVQGVLQPVVILEHISESRPIRP